ADSHPGVGALLAADAARWLDLTGSGGRSPTVASPAAVVAPVRRGLRGVGGGLVGGGWRWGGGVGGAEWALGLEDVVVEFFFALLQFCFQGLVEVELVEDRLAGQVVGLVEVEQEAGVGG